MADITTMKVPISLRNRIRDTAQREGRPQSAVLQDMLAEYERRKRMDAVRAAYQDGPDKEYRDLTAAWDDATAADGLDA